MKSQVPDSKLLLEVVNVKMPYGKYKGSLLCDIPEYYLNWMKRKGFPKGRLGIQLELMYEIRLNGLMHLLDPIRKDYK